MTEKRCQPWCCVRGLDQSRRPCTSIHWPCTSPRPAPRRPAAPDRNPAEPCESSGSWYHTPSQPKNHSQIHTVTDNHCQPTDLSDWRTGPSCSMVSYPPIQLNTASSTLAHQRQY